MTIRIDRKYLYRAYAIENRSTVSIAKEFNCDPTSIRYRLKKFGIPLRNLSESHLTGFEFAGNKEVLYGCLLGDASLEQRNKKTGQGLASFKKSNTGYDHVVFASREILASDPQDRIVEFRNDSGNSAFKFTTLCCPYFKHEYKRWYNGKQKIVPRDLQLTPQMVLHWFMDDGHTSWKNKQKTRFCLGFSTESFSEEDCNFLSEQLGLKKIDSYLGKSHGGYGFKIMVRTSSLERFFRWIGPCPEEVPSMKYKWKIQ